MNSSPTQRDTALQWLPPTTLLRDDPALKSATPDVLQMLMSSHFSADWLKTPAQLDFKSRTTYIELQLRQALAATDSAPDPFRTACVCECLAKLPEVAANAGIGSLLHLMRQEILRAVYIEETTHHHHHPASASPRSGRSSPSSGLLADSGRALLQRTTYFAECARLQKIAADAVEKLDDWKRTKEDLSMASDGRNELLHLALSKWSTALDVITRAHHLSRDGHDAPELFETTRKLSSLLDSMQQHASAIDELQRIALLEPEGRMHAQLSAFHSHTRQRLLSSMLKSHASSLSSDLERQAWRKHLVSELESTYDEKPTAEEGTQAGAGLQRASIGSQTTHPSTDRGDILADVAAFVGPHATSVLPAALEAMHAEDGRYSRRLVGESAALLPLLRQLERRCEELEQKAARAAAR